MNNQDLFSQLNKLKSLKPHSEWKERSRDILLAEIKSSKPTQKKPSWRFQFSESFRIYIPAQARLAVKPILISIIVLALIFEGSILTVNASKSSLPGDTLYSVKMAAEKVQVSLTSSEEAKAKLEVKFAGHRVEEIVKISQEVSSASKQKKVELAISGLKENINTAKTRLQNLENQEKPVEAVAVAQVLEEKTEEYQEALTQSIIIEPVKEFKIAVMGAIDLVYDTSQEAMEVIVEKVVSGEVEVSRDEVVDLVEKKIEKAKAKVEETKVKLDEVSVKIEEVKDTTSAEAVAEEGVLIETVDTEVADVIEEVAVAVSQGEEAVKTLEEAKELLILDDLAGAVSKVKEVKGIVKETEKVAEDQGEIVEVLIIEKVAPSTSSGPSEIQIEAVEGSEEDTEK